MARYGSTSPEQLADAVFELVSSKGLEAASVREVAGLAGVSIGAVQHYFATKDDLLSFAFAQLVTRVGTRIAEVGSDLPPAEFLIAALSELLPLDLEREREGRVMLAFAARAATMPAVAETQRRTLGEIRAQLAAYLTDRGIPDPAPRAALLLAVVDGLTLDALSAGGRDSHAALRRMLSLQVRLVLGP